MTQTALRIDPMLGHRTLFSLRRAERPVELSLKFETTDNNDCPFCRGNEPLTPNTLHSATLPDRPAGSKEWQVRVIPNLYPALEYDPAKEAGSHEVIIESPDHLTRFSDLGLKPIQLLVEVYRDRLAAISQESKNAYTLIFKNEGVQAGASLAHVHSQLMALPYVPAGVQKRLAFNHDFVAKQGQTYFESAIENARQEDRIVWESPDLIAFCPYASRYPYETWILPRAPMPYFEKSSATLLAQLSEGWLCIAKAYEAVLPEGAFNMVLQSAPFKKAESSSQPFDISSSEHYHWHMELLPRVAMLAGFECGVGDYINTVFPEGAAAKLREYI